MNTKLNNFTFALVTLNLTLLAPTLAFAQEATAEKVSVDAIKERYWAGGNQSELGVVQNRLYSKDKRLELDVFGGILTSDPFLSTRALGGGIGFHFSEYFSAHLLAWKATNSASSALTFLRNNIAAEANTNPPSAYYGAEGRWSVLYGKLSLVGKAILYYDMNLAFGLGATKTESGTYVTPHLGLGQQVFLSKRVSIKVDYRAMYYKETLTEKAVISRLGQVAGTRSNFTHSVSVGLGFLFDLTPSKLAPEEETKK